MNRFALHRLTLTLYLLAGCSTDIIDHGGDDLMNRTGPDAGSRDATVVIDAGPPCELAAFPPDDFSAVQIGRTITMVVELENVSSVACVISSVTVNPSAAPFTPTFGGLLPQTIAAGASFTVDVAFAPTAVGPVDADLSINHGDGTVEVALHGVGAPNDVDGIASAEVTVQNVSGQDLFLVTEGWRCDAMDLGVPQAIAYQSVCEGPPPMPPTATIYRRIRPGESVPMVWDGREFVYVTYDFDCTPRGNSRFIISLVAGGRQPVGPLPRTIDLRVAFESTFPMGCRDEGNFVHCEPNMFGGSGNFTTIAQLCPATNVTTPTSFVLNPGSITSVTIPISP